ncbi:MAG: DUF4405 domain-containing protein [Alphaproteobacteria bacterium]|nr:DUF4405 domain-containing protein [Alphaproteobacteria bacterium]
MNKQTIQVRPIISFLMVVGFLILSVSGIVLYVAPHGGLARSLNWRFLFLDKAAWANLHISFGFLFLITGLFHLWMNRKPLMGYLRSHAATVRDSWTSKLLKPEMYVALVLSGFLFAASVVPFEPVTTLLDWRKEVQKLWDAKQGSSTGEGLSSGAGQGQGQGQGQGKSSWAPSGTP